MFVALLVTTMSLAPVAGAIRPNAFKCSEPLLVEVLCINDIDAPL